MMPENEMTGEQLGEELYKLLKKIHCKMMLSSIQAQKVSGANILFFGFGDGTTGQFEYVDDETWKLSISKGEIE